ncbi:hypothetical protein HRI_000492500 [Hibiscus trionum]|uniref:Uncharacterized protein n=1 Tax=Hibiscus trionum TaxID=183268 RepID=A0A9W7H046_HIBTR|nr:hypothetical protein HRI_000492500 [Hibiscus trionum]
MVKPVRQKNNVVLTFRVTPPINPATTKRVSHPRVSLVPREVRRLAWNESFEGLEPVSPRVSCTGHIDCQMKGKPGARKHKPASSPLAQALAEQIKRKVLSVRKRGYESDALVAASEIQDTAAQFVKGRSMLSDRDWRTYGAEEKGKVLNGTKRGYESNVSDVQAAAPSLQQMRQFCKGRSTLSEFDRSADDAKEKGVKRKRS